MKNLKKIFLLSIIFCGIMNVNALEDNSNNTYYTNKKGVKMTMEQYNWLSNQHNDYFVEYITQDNFDHYISDMNHTIKSQETIYIKTDSLIDLHGNILETKQKEISKEEYEEYNPDIEPYVSCGASCWETDYKKIDSKLYDLNDNNKYKISTTLTWKKMPANRYVDVFGIIYKNFKIVNKDARKMSMFYSEDRSQGYIEHPLSYGDSLYYYEENNWTAGGWAGLYNIPTSNKLSYLEFTMETTGWNYGGIKAQSSYQHAQKSVTKKDVYTNMRMDWNGYGHVFNFGKNAYAYDQMGGAGVQL